MTSKKSKFLTFFISLIPGAGEMYLGFYKTGASIMVLFFGSYAIFSYLFRPFLSFLPVLWFYSFFHTHNLNNTPDEEFYGLEDDYLFHIQPRQLVELAQKYRKPLACLLIFVGVSMIWNNVSHILSSIAHWFIWSDAIMSLVRYWTNAIPQFAAAALIIWIGWHLIRNKKETLITPPYLADKQIENKDTVAAASEK